MQFLSASLPRYRNIEILTKLAYFDNTKVISVRNRLLLCYDFQEAFPPFFITPLVHDFNRNSDSSFWLSLIYISQAGGGEFVHNFFNMGRSFFSPFSVSN